MLILEQIRVGGDRNFGYLIGDRDAGEAAVVDPSFDPDRVLARASAQGLTVRYVINTHGHPDHANGNRRACGVTGAPLVAHPEAASRPGIAAQHGQTLRVGGLTLELLHTPGHSSDSVCVVVDGEICISGDTLFVGKVGGTAGRSAAEIEYRSLHEVLLRLPDATTIWPGHDYGCRPSSTIALERRTNPFLLCRDLEAFLDLKARWADFKAEQGLI